MQEQSDESVSDALTIARWCWPSRECMEEDGRIFCCGRRLPEWDPDDPNCIALAERVLIERGLASAYGEALEREFLGPPRMLDDDGEITHADIARFATAPLSARVSAMAAVIRARGTT